MAFCAHAILQENIFNIPDTKNDDRFFDNPIVSGDFKLRFYAGVPILDPQYNLPIGTICVIDHKPRELTSEQIKSLEALRNLVQKLLLLRFTIKNAIIMEEQLHNQNNRQELILDGAGLGSWDLWLETNKVHFDQPWCTMLGLEFEKTPQELSTWESRVHPEDLPVANADFQAYLKGTTAYYENIHRIRHANGEWVWILDRGRFSEWNKDGKPIKFTGTHLDITRYKKSQLLSAEIQKIANIGGWEYEINTEKILWSEQTYKIHKLPPETPLNFSTIMNFYPKEERERIEKYLKDCLLGTPYSNSFKMIDFNGQQKWVEITSIPIIDSDNIVKSIHGTIQDITFKIESEEAIELNRMKAAQNAKLASLGEMSAGIAHEINNPLAIINGTLVLLNKYRNNDLKFEEKLETALKAVNRIVKIVNGLQKFSRSSDSVELTQNSMSKIINESMIIIDIKARRLSVPIEINLSTNGVILCDEIEIEQVIINLMNNAIFAVKDLKEKWVKLNLFEENNEVVVQIIDSGSGISEKVESKLFQPFFTTKPVGEGTGLGLSICRGILQHHNATIKLNKSFSNTCFEIRFLKLKGVRNAS